MKKKIARPFLKFVKSIWKCHDSFRLDLLGHSFFVVLFFLIKDFIRNPNHLENSSWLKNGIIGFVMNYFDVLGICAFAPQTALLKFTRQTEDKVMPGTPNVANTLPVLFQALIFITISGFCHFIPQQLCCERGFGGEWTTTLCLR